MSVARYPEYKDSGAQWLGHVPAHWTVSPLKFLAEFKSGGTPDKSNRAFWDGDVPWASAKDLKVAELFDTEDHLTSTAIEAGAATLVEPGTVLVVVRGMILARTFPISRTRVPMAINQDLKAVVAKIGVSQDYLAWLLEGSAQETLSRLDEAGHGTKALRMDAWAAMLVPVPPPEEQEHVSSFLNRETAKIDTLAAEQKHLIELLQEKRQAVISQAVTKGLKPGVSLKDSGVEWLGQVPAHWRVGGARFYLSILSGYAFPSVGFSENEEDTKLLRGINVGVSRLRWDDVVYWERTPGDGLDVYELKAGDLVVGMDRPLIADGMRVAKVMEHDLPCLLLQRVASIAASTELNADFLHSLLSSEFFVAHFSPETTGVSVPHISPEQIRSFRIPVPPVHEQEEIARLVSRVSMELDELAAQARKAIDLLQERRAALISAAVTGKIDLRGLAPQPQAATA